MSTMVSYFRLCDKSWGVRAKQAFRVIINTYKEYASAYSFLLQSSVKEASVSRIPIHIKVAC